VRIDLHEVVRGAGKRNINGKKTPSSSGRKLDGGWLLSLTSRGGRGERACAESETEGTLRKNRWGGVFPRAGKKKENHRLGSKLPGAPSSERIPTSSF